MHNFSNNIIIYLIFIFLVASRATSAKQLNMAAPADVVIDATNVLSKFSHIIQKCKCNAKIHLLCLNIWIKQTQSCPICRTKCITIKDLQKHNLQKYYIACIINIYVFIILIFNLYLCSNLFIYILFQIYLFVKL